MSLYDMPEHKYHPEYCDKVIEWMSKGKFKIQIAAKLGITEKTFYAWVKEHPEFKEAVERGNALSFDWWFTEGKKKYFDNDNDKGFKYWQTCVRNMFGIDAIEPQKPTNNIQIGSMTVLNNIANDKEKLLEFINNKLLTTNVIEGQILNKDSDNETE